MNTQNAFTIDVEDYYHVAAFSKSISRDDWDSMESHVVKNTRQMMDLLSKANVQATFFILGWVAERNPTLVKEILASGHEIACHGYSHELIYKQSPQVFREETRKAKIILEDIIGAGVKGYRAASYSITKKSLWALDVLSECGFEYDSSIFPVRHDNYGIVNSPRMPYKIKTKNGINIKEFPLSTLNLFKYNLPVAGGGYFRLFPYTFTKYAFRSLNNTDPFVFYIHPWEIDKTQPRINASLFSRFRHYNNIEICEERLTRLLKDFNFTTMEKVLNTTSLEVTIESANLGNQL